VASSAAGDVYKEQQIPAITGAASEARVTVNNDWFFRLFRDAGGQGQFLADYARYRFGAREIAVIQEKGTAGDEFASALRDHAKSEGIRIAADLEFAPSQVTDAATMAQIADKLAKLPKGEIVVLGTQYAETPPVLRVLRDKLGAFTSMGYSSLATDGLNGLLGDAESSDHNAGYYTDGFTVAAPQLEDVAEYAQTVFASRYRTRYGSDPTPEAVRWYEGAQLMPLRQPASPVPTRKRTGAAFATGSLPGRRQSPLRRESPDRSISTRTTALNVASRWGSSTKATWSQRRSSSFRWSTPTKCPGGTNCRPAEWSLTRVTSST